MNIDFDSHFHGGNGTLGAQPSAGIVEIDVRADRGTRYWQWFYFRLAHDQKQQPPKLRLRNAKNTLSLRAWQVTQIVASINGHSWQRIPVVVEDDAISFDAIACANPVFYALFPPYNAQQQSEYETRACSAGATLLELGTSVLGTSLNALRIGEPRREQRSLWVIARQHAGETMAQWWSEGFVDHLLTTKPRQALHDQHTAVYVVPNMNPDGSALGQIRTNGAGVDLNRAWQTPSSDIAPEVACVLRHMANTGVDLFLDVHGDELTSFVYMLSNGGIANFTSEQTSLVRHFCTTLLSKTKDFQMQFGGRTTRVGEADLRIGANQVGHLFDCIGLTLEMPFRDHFANADRIKGWTIERSRTLGTACASSLVDILAEI